MDSEFGEGAFPLLLLDLEWLLRPTPSPTANPMIHRKRMTNMSNRFQPPRFAICLLFLKLCFSPSSSVTSSLEYEGGALSELNLDPRKAWLKAKWLKA